VSHRAAGRGQPLLALGLVFAGWVALRVALWESPLLAPGGELASRYSGRPAALSGHAEAERAVAPGAPLPMQVAIASIARVHDTSPIPAQSLVVLPSRASAAALPRDQLSAPGAEPEAHLRLPDAAPHLPRQALPTALSPALNAGPHRSFTRWSGDAWLLYRPGSSGPLGAEPFAGRYGASQAGAVLRYRLQPEGHRPAFYLRASSALGGTRDRHAALGLSARPVPRLPVSAQAELRVVQSVQGTELAPAVLAVSELAPLALPFDLRAEAYLAGGYVGGQNRTAFVGGQARVDRALGEVAGAAVRLGVGAWGGAQRGARALDIGPAALAELPLGERRITVEAGYRWRVAGTAEPRSGPALTVSTGF
jgi:hypothetical protein